MQSEPSNATTQSQEITGQQAPALIDIEAVARILGCSSRHVRRLIDSRRMPKPFKLGALLRWTRKEIDAWLDNGSSLAKNNCPCCYSRATGSFYTEIFRITVATVFCRSATFFMSHSKKLTLKILNFFKAKQPQSGSSADGARFLTDSVFCAFS